MDAGNELDIYIPKEAEVRVVPLSTLPNSVLKKMDIPLPDRKCADSPDVIWICPAVMKRKGREPASHGEGCFSEQLRIASNPLQMSFISSNRTAWKLLKNISSGSGPSRTQLPRRDSAPLANQNAVVIYQERIYLCIRRSTRNQGQPKTRDLQPSPRPAGPATSSSPEQAPRGERGQKMNHVAGKALKRKAVSPVSAAHEADGPSLTVPRPEPAPEEAAPWQKNTSDDGEHETRSPWNSACGSRRSSPDRSVDRTWEVRETLGAASSSLSTEFDFKELENEEKIAQLKAKFMQADAALGNLLF